jgi:uncharacterized protein DUF4253
MVPDMTDSELEKCIDTLPFDLAGGTLIRPHSCGGYYVSNDSPAPGTWAELRSEHPRSRLWPVLLRSREDARADQWDETATGFRWSRWSHDRGDRDAAEILEHRWHAFCFPADLTPDERAEVTAQTAPYGPDWPGLAPGASSLIPPDNVADDFAEGLLSAVTTRLGLFMVQRGADVPGAVGWHPGGIEPDEVSAILRSWEDRFGVRLILIGFNTMVLSVAAPPTTVAAAQRIAAEHFVFCSENVAMKRGALTRYAEDLVGSLAWSFWWDRNP